MCDVDVWNSAHAARPLGVGSSLFASEREPFHFGSRGSDRLVQAGRTLGPIDIYLMLAGDVREPLRRDAPDARVAAPLADNSGLGVQKLSPKRSAPAFSFATSRRFT